MRQRMKQKILDAAVAIAHKTKTVSVTRTQLARKLKISPVTVTYYVSMREVSKYIYKELTQ